MSTTPKTKAKPRPAPTKARKAAKEAKPQVTATKAATPPTAGDTAVPARKPTLLDAAAQILRGQDEPMGVKDLTQRILAAGLWVTKGKTPEATLYSALIRDIGSRDGNSRFLKTGRGRFALSDAAKA